MLVPETFLIDKQGYHNSNFSKLRVLLPCNNDIFYRYTISLLDMLVINIGGSHIALNQPENTCLVLEPATQAPQNRLLNIETTNGQIRATRCNRRNP